MRRLDCAGVRLWGTNRIQISAITMTRSATLNHRRHELRIPSFSPATLLRKSQPRRGPPGSSDDSRQLHNRYFSATAGGRTLTRAVALLGLDASVEFASAKRGKRVVTIKVYRPARCQSDEVDHGRAGRTADCRDRPRPTAGTRSAYQNYGEKESFDWAIADAGVVLEMDGNLCCRAVVTMGTASSVVRRSAQE